MVREARSDASDATDAVVAKLTVADAATLSISDAQEVVAAAALVAGLNGFEVENDESDGSLVSLDADRRDELSRLVEPALNAVEDPRGELASELESANLMPHFQAKLRGIRGACLTL